MTVNLLDSMIRWLNYESEPLDTPICDFDRIKYELRPCDVLLIEGRSRISSVIRMITSSSWTHAALYIGRPHDIFDADQLEKIKQFMPVEPSSQILIESMLGQGTVANNIDIYKHDHIRICRPKGIDQKDSQEVIRYAISRLGTDYDVRQIFDLARFLFPWIVLPKRWRSSLFRHNPGNNTRTVCSTMIAEAFGFIQFPILPLIKKTNEQGGVQLFRRNPKLCVPSHFDYSPYFEIIKYPYIDFAHHSTYRLLPWKGSGTLSFEESRMYFHEQQKPVVKPPTNVSTDQQNSPSMNDEIKNDEAINGGAMNNRTGSGETLNTHTKNDSKEKAKTNEKKTNEGDVD